MSSSAFVILLNSESSLEEHFTADWQISQFSHMQMPVCTKVFSPVMEIDVKFVYQIWYKTISLHEVGDISTLHVVLKKLPGPPVPESLLLDLQVSVHYSNGKIYNKFRPTNQYYVNNFTSLVCLDNATRFSDRLGNSMSSPHHGVLIQSQSLILSCRMKFSHHLLPTASYNEDKKSVVNLTTFVEDFRALYESSAFSDVSIQIGDKTIKSHKSVLASHSPVFQRMLEHEFKESKTGVIDICNVDYDLFVSFLKYLYCAEVEEKSLTHVQQLYTLADMYDVKTLKQKCTEIIADSCLEVGRICEILELAYCYNDDKLKNIAKWYAAQNMKEILPTTQWKNLVAVNPAIGYEVLLYVYLPEEIIN